MPEAYNSLKWMLDRVISSIMAGTTISASGTWAKGLESTFRQHETFSACSVHNDTSDFCKLSWGIKGSKTFQRKLPCQRSVESKRFRDLFYLHHHLHHEMYRINHNDGDGSRLWNVGFYLSTDTSQWPENIPAYLLSMKASNVTESLYLVSH
jgi:hypothetical protein